jgi:hypothetical protein
MEAWHILNFNRTELIKGCAKTVGLPVVTTAQRLIVAGAPMQERKKQPLESFSREKPSPADNVRRAGLNLLTIDLRHVKSADLRLRSITRKMLLLQEGVKKKTEYVLTVLLQRIREQIAVQSTSPPIA